MTSTEIQIAVAEEMRWTVSHIVPANDNPLPLCSKTPEKKIWKHKSGSLWEEWQLPRYTKSLDACHEFEKDAPDDYWDMLYAVCNPLGAIGCFDEAAEATSIGWMITLRATPLQRCEAFLRYKGKWKN